MTLSAWNSSLNGCDVCVGESSRCSRDRCGQCWCCNFRLASRCGRCWCCRLRLAGRCGRCWCGNLRLRCRWSSLCCCSSCRRCRCGSDPGGDVIDLSSCLFHSGGECAGGRELRADASGLWCRCCNRSFPRWDVSTYASVHRRGISARYRGVVVAHPAGRADRGHEMHGLLVTCCSVGSLCARDVG